MPAEPLPCPHCGQNAPLVHRGVMTYCTACSRPRAPFTTSSVTLAGQPSRVGGTVAAVLGWLVLGGGLMLAIAVGLILQAIFPAGFAGWGIGAMIAIAAVTVGGLLLVGGRSLQRSGAIAARSVRDQAIFALAANKRGILTPQEVAVALAVDVKEADTLLTDLTKATEDVTLELDDEGRLLYRFAKYAPKQRWPETGGARVAAGPERVESEDAELAAAAAPQRRRGAKT